MTIVPLSAAGGKNFGGKATALSALIQSGFTVPDGYVIGADMGELSPEVEVKILDAFEALRYPFVAVRSSAVNEDSKNAAWAGQMQTYLNVTKNTLIESVKMCWESAQSDRAVSYASQHGLESGNVAVIVQKMIQSQTSGVAFSVHPVTKDTNTIVIEAGFGLGEAVVSGEITPDTYMVRKNDMKIVEKRISHQQKQLVLNNIGDNIWLDMQDKGAQQTLNNEQIVQLAKEVNRLEIFFGYPIDVEWGIMDDELYILQARPITTLGL